MNIEEERKAFEEHGHETAKALKWDETNGRYQELGGSVWHQNAAKHANYLFYVWCAAKEHAAEMGKPTGRVKEGASGDWWVFYDVYQYGGIESREAAEKWLTDRGYRVIEE